MISAESFKKPLTFALLIIYLIVISFSYNEKTEDKTINGEFPTEISQNINLDFSPQILSSTAGFSKPAKSFSPYLTDNINRFSILPKTFIETVILSGNSVLSIPIAVYILNRALIL